MSEEKEVKKKRGKKAENKIAPLKRSRELADIPLLGFKPQEYKLFVALNWFCQGKGARQVTISFDEFREITGYNRRGDEALVNKLKEVSSKFATINIMEERKNGFKLVVPFIDFEVNTDDKTFTVGIHKEYVKAINDLDGTPGKKYALLDVIAISNFKSVYSMHCLGHLSIYRKYNEWEATVEELKYYLDIPAKYRPSDINDKVLPVITKEFEEAGIFEYFEVTPRTEETRKKSTGRKKTLGYYFSFKFDESHLVRDKSKKKEKPKDTMDCPVCGKPLVRKTRKDGNGDFYGHDDYWKEGACKFTISADKVDRGQVSKTSDNIKQEKNYVTRAELDDYYRYIRREEIMALAQRKEDIENNEPEIWSMYMNVRKIQAESLNKMAAFSFTDEGRKEKEETREELERQRGKFKKALSDKGYEEDYLEVHYRCPKCRDTGQRDDGMYCSCRAERTEEAALWLKKKKEDEEIA